MSSDDSKRYADERGSPHLYEVTLLANGIDPRAASFADFRIVYVRAVSPINAQIIARNEHDAGFAFDAKRVPE